jgi:esterase FrsA
LTYKVDELPYGIINSKIREKREMKRYRIFIGLLILFIIVIGYLYRQPLVLRITGMRPFVEDRFGGWVRAGADEGELDAALRRIYDPRGSDEGSWVYELSKLAARHEEMADRADASGDRDTAFREYRIAALYYFIARFPFVSSPAKEEAYKKHIACYLKAAKYFDPSLVVLRIPFEGKEIIGYLRVPRVKRPPLIVISGGVDTWKSDIDDQVEAMLAEGLAVLAIDMPGTGESQWKLEPDSQRVYSRVLAYMKARPEIDGKRMGVYLMSFAGLFAVKLALVDPNVKVAVNVGGPIHLSYTAEHIKKVPDVMIATISHAMGVAPGDSGFEDMVVRAKPFSLMEQGLLKKPKHQAALLSINGDQDRLVPIDDLYIVSRSGVKQDEWVYKGDGHCAPNNMPEYQKKAALWLKKNL